MNFSRHNNWVVFFFLLCFLQIKTNAQQSDSAKIIYYNNKAINTFNDYRYEKAELYLDSAMRLGTNSNTFYLIAYIAAHKKNWAKAIKYGEQSLSMDSSYLPTYTVLFNAYYGSKQWDKALAIGEKAKKSDNTGFVPDKISYATTARQFEKISMVLFWLLFLFLGIVMLVPLFKSSSRKEKSQPSQRPGKFSLIVLTCSAVSLFFYLLFFSISKWIWSTNPNLGSEDITPLIRIFIYERDGFESLALYALVIADIIFCILISSWLLKLNLDRSGLGILTLIVLALAGYYFYQLGFSPPTIELQQKFQSKYFIVVLVSLVFAILLFMLSTRQKWMATIIVVLLSAFVSFIPNTVTSGNDLAYILSPALRLYNGAKFSEIYFQYDIFLSLLALGWMKLNLSLESFPVLAEISFFLFFLGCFIFANRFFKTKGLAGVFIIALIIIRYYTVWEAQNSILQVTPLRLDLWLILLLVSWKKGIYHWLTGVTLGFLIIFHRNLGLIYTISYFLLLFSLFASDVISDIIQKTSNGGFFQKMIEHLKRSWISLSIIVASLVICVVMTGEIFSSSAVAYRKYGIGMLPIDRDSFYWYILIALTTLSVLLVRYRNLLNEKYFSIGLFCVLLAVGNSMYFFGRSHDNNILNISGLLIICLFLVFDIVIFSHSQKAVKPQPSPVKNQRLKPTVARKQSLLDRKFYLLLPFLFLFIATFYYSPRIHDKFSRQLANLENGDFTFPLLVTPIDTGAIRALTHNSDKVFFLDFSKDFYYYYYGQYKPVGLYNPISTMIFKKDLIHFLQDLLNDHYYIIANKNRFEYPYEYFQELKYNSSAEKNDLVAIANDSLPFVMVTGKNELEHVTTKDSSSNNGVYRHAINLPKNFTVEALFKPTGTQRAEATILSNFGNIGVFSGMNLRLNDSATNQYIFEIGSGSLAMQNVTFTLSNDQWHYLNILISDSSLRVYDWEKLVVQTSLTSPFVNNNNPLMIGNRRNRDAHFNGLIREIKITDQVNEASISEKSAQLSKLMTTGSY